MPPELLQPSPKILTLFQTHAEDNSRAATLDSSIPLVLPNRLVTNPGPLGRPSQGIPHPHPITPAIHAEGEGAIIQAERHLLISHQTNSRKKQTGLAGRRSCYPSGSLPPLGKPATRVGPFIRAFLGAHSPLAGAHPRTHSGPHRHSWGLSFLFLRAARAWSSASDPPCRQPRNTHASSSLRATHVGRRVQVVPEGRREEAQRQGRPGRRKEGAPSGMWLLRCQGPA